MRRDLLRFGPYAASLIALLGATAAHAQDMRYLSWTGKPQTPIQGQPQSGAQTQPVSNARYPSMAAQGRPSRYSPSVSSGGLTPADAWFGPVQPRPQALAPAGPAPQPYAPVSLSAAPRPVRSMAATPSLPLPAYAQGSQSQVRTLPPYAAVAAQPVPGHPEPQPIAPAGVSPSPPLTAAPPAAWTQPGYAPQVYSGAPSPAPQAPSSPVVAGPGWASPQPAMTGATLADPMAPRRDAPIFSIQAAQPAGSPAPVAAPAPQLAGASGPAREGARYYSVHRQAGRDPDPAEIPESVYAVIPEGAFLDAARSDLADPPPAPLATRRINGRVQAVSRGDEAGLP